MDIPWLNPIAERWRQQQRQARAPHAVMLLGAAGVGKRALADWLAGSVLRPGDNPATPAYRAEPRAYPDLHRVTPPPEKHAIGVDQVRELVAELSLTSHDGRGKAAIVDPAQAMTTNAANSLLKTLEEPPGHALLILVADRTGWLPPTIMSRCQRIAVHLPGEREALDWLDRLKPGGNWAAALAEAGGAPLAAVDALEQLEETATMARELAAVAGGGASPLDVAARWAKQEPAPVLDWLGRQVQVCIRRRAGGAAAGQRPVLPDSVLQRMDSRNLFCYLDIINRIRGQAAGSYNAQLTFESLLIDWAEGLETYGAGAGELRRAPLFGAR